MRLNRFLASAGLGSRRSVEELILTGCVRINGRPVTELATQVQPGDAVKVGQRLIRSEETLTAVLYKPPGFICTASDEQGRETIFDLLPAKWPRVFHVGRLDKESEGLLLLTNDGDLSNSLMHPSFKVEKEYEVTLKQNFDARLLPKLLAGVHIEGGRAKAERATLEGPRRLRLVLTQGINRQIHKMLWRVGEYDVERLARVRIGPINIQGLRPGECRVLTSKELAALRPKEPAARPQAARPQKAPRSGRRG
jgi:23S rRNA pseudouridine2605 synthase